jgi:hypothetical protein
MEFMSQGIPVVASRTKIDTYYYQEGTVHFFESGNSEDMARAMLDVYRDQQLRLTLAARGYEYSQQNSWDQKKQRYLDLIDSLSTERFESVPSSDSAANKTVHEAATTTTVRQEFESVLLKSDPQTVHKAD